MNAKYIEMVFAEISLVGVHGLQRVLSTEQIEEVSDEFQEHAKAVNTNLINQPKRGKYAIASEYQKEGKS